MLVNAHKQGIVTEVSNLVNEYLQGNYNRSKDDLALLSVPQFSDDHWVQDSEEKCNLLLNVQKVKPFLEQTDEVESDVLSDVSFNGRPLHQRRSELLRRESCSPRCTNRSKSFFLSTLNDRITRTDFLSSSSSTSAIGAVGISTIKSISSFQRK